MGFSHWWSRFRDDLHAPKETEHALVSRLAHTPPEFWRREDNTAARRLLHRRRELYQSYILKGYPHHDALHRVNEELPEGPFWPQIPRRNDQLKNQWREDRMINAIAQALNMVGNENSIIYQDIGGEMYAMNPYTQQAISLAHLGM